MLQIFFCFWSAALRAGRATEFQMGLRVWPTNAALTGCWQQRNALHWMDWNPSVFPSFCCKLFSAETVLVSVCAHMHFTQQGSFPGRGLGTTVAAEEQLSNLSSCLPKLFSLLFPNKLKLKEKEVTFPSPNWILLCLSLEITLSQFSFH